MVLSIFAIKSKCSFLKYRLFRYIMLERKSLPYLLVVILLLSYSCRTTKYVPENEYLLEKYELKGEGKKINKDELSSYVKQKPNKKILGLKFHLGVYSLIKKRKRKLVQPHAPDYWRRTCYI